MEQAFSPTFKEPVKSINLGMDFYTALRSVATGEKIHKLEWENKEFYGFLKAEVLTLHKPDGRDYQWLISAGDLAGTDYIIV